MVRRTFLFALMTVAIEWPAAGSAQQWRVGVDGGRIRSTLDPSARESESLVTGLAYEDSATALRIATGIPTNSDAAYWGALGTWKRLSAKKGAVIGGIDFLGNAFAFQGRDVTTESGGGLLDPLTRSTTRSSGSAVAGQALPLIGFETGPFHLQARAGVSYYTASTNGQNRDRTVRVGDIQLAFQPSSSLALIPVVRLFQAQNENAATLAEASALIALGRLSFRGSAGQWLAGVDSSGSDKFAWSAGGQLRLTDRASVSANARHDSFDPLYLNPPQTSWSLGMSFLLGRRAKTTSEPVPADYHGGMATIRLPVSLSASQPRVAGDFNGWIPAAMESDGRFWSYTVAAKPGVYNYAFVAPDGTWYVPETVPGRKDDGMGGHVAVLVIK